MRFIPDHLKTQEMCNKAMRTMPNVFQLIPFHFKTQGMCTKAIEANPLRLYHVHDDFKTQGLCNDAVEEKPSLQYVPDYFVTQQQIKTWNDDDHGDDGSHWDDNDGGHWDDVDDDEDKFFEWYDGYQKRKAQKAKSKEELLSIV